MFDKNKLKDFKDAQVIKVECPEWAEMGDIYVRSMTGISRDNHEMGIYDQSKIPDADRVYNMRATMVVATACDAEGNLIFTTKDADWLGKKSAKVLDRLFDAARKISGMSDSDVAEMEKSLEPAQS